MLTKDSIRSAADDALRAEVGHLFSVLNDRLCMVASGTRSDTAEEARRAFSRGLACLRDTYAVACEEIESLSL